MGGGCQRRNRPGQRPVQDLGALRDERGSKAFLDFLATTEVGWTAGPPVAEEERALGGGRKIRGRD